MPSKRKTTASEADNAASTSPAESSTNTSAPVKRQRVSRACDQCRAAREKCDGKQPKCFACVFQNRACTYESSPKKRGVQTGYIKTLEVALAWLFDKVPGTEDALENLLMHDGGQGQSLLAGKESGKSDRLHKRWRRSKVQKEIDRILSGGNPTQARSHKSPPSDNEESDAAPSEKAPHIKSQMSATAGETAPLGDNLSSGLGDGLERSGTTSTMVKLPPSHWRLLDIYFSYTHCWFPILEKQDLLKTVYLYPGEGLDLLSTSTSSASHAELWAALALASYQNASSAESTAQCAPNDADHSPDELYAIARRLIPSEEGHFDTQHARALLLLALINIGKGKKTSAWILVGLAHRICVDISELPSGDEPTSRRVTAVLMGCSILDTLISVHRRGIAGLETAAIMEGMSIPEDSLDEWQPWAPCDGFGQGSSGPAISSRSPAYSLTTFNQLHDVFKFIRRRSLQAQAGSLPTDHPAGIMMLLHQTIKPRLPFGDFIVARDSSSASIPSAYVLRILYLWASAVLGSTRDPLCVLILEAVEQYLSQFGACGAPPFLASCLVMMAQHRSFGDLHPQSKDRWYAIRDTLASVWAVPTDRRPSMIHVGSVSGPTGSSDPSLGSAAMHTTTSISATTPSDIYTTNSLQTPTIPAKHYSPNNTSYMLGTYLPSKPGLNPGPDPTAAAAANIDMLHTHSLVHGGRPPRHGQPPQQATVPGTGISYPESVNEAPLDYDALLDDLSSMDYVDRVDADPQFMANLGFAPGADITEILSREFGAT